MERTLRVGTRTSPLALKQLEEVTDLLKKEFPEVEVEVVGFRTAGDRDKSTPLDRVEKEDFFTDELDRALLDGRIDCAVHSAKDLPEDLAGGLAIAALTPSIDPDEVLVSRMGWKLAELPVGARIGTSSLRRKEQLKKFRPDLRIVDIRGNIEERLERLEAGGLDGIVIAAAGLVRLGLEERITERIPPEIVQPHPRQGALAVVVREKDRELRDLIGRLETGAAR